MSREQRSTSAEAGRPNYAEIVETFFDGRMESGPRRAVRDALIARFYEEGVSTKTIARAFGLKNANYIYELMKRAGCPVVARSKLAERVRILEEQMASVQRALPKGIEHG